MGDSKAQLGPKDDTEGPDEGAESGGAEPSGSPQFHEPAGEPTSAVLVVGVGASAGGLEAFSELLRN